MNNEENYVSLCNMYLIWRNSDFHKDYYGSKYFYKVYIKDINKIFNNNRIFKKDLYILRKINYSNMYKIGR